MKQSRSVVSPAVGTTTEMMIICVEWTYRPGAKFFIEVAEGSAVAEVSTGFAERIPVTEVSAGVAERTEVGYVKNPWYVGNTCDGCKVLLQPS